jgi:hypothetical protein
MAKPIPSALPDVQAGAPRKLVSEQRAAPLHSNLRAEISDDELRQQIAEAAYYRAKQRGFAPGYELKDWIEAEADILNKLGLQP